MIYKKRLNLIKKRLNNYPLFSFLDKGTRGEVYKLSKTRIVKIQRDDAPIKETIKNEYNIGKKIQKYSFFPKIIEYNEKLKFMIREFVKGKEIQGIKLNKYKINRLLKLAFILDKEGINQQELTNPFKHIFIYKKKIMMIDFERAKTSIKPKNLSQITQYLCKKLTINPKELIKLMKKYKKTFSTKDYLKIVDYFNLNNI